MESINAGITAEPLMYKELKTLILYLDKNKLVDKKSIYKRIVEENIFQYKSPKSTSRRFSALFKRYLSLSVEERKIISTGSFDDASLMALYAVYKTNNLFREFFDTVVKTKFKNNDLNFSSKDIYIFLGEIEIKYNNISKWTDSTRNKIVEVITKILKDSLVLSSNKILQKKSISGSAKQSIISNGGYLFLDVIKTK